MNIYDFKRFKKEQNKISMITCYDYVSARIIAQSKIDCVLVGDSVAMVVHGHDSTVMATIDMMVMHTKAVARGLGQQFLMSDFPFLSHRISQAETISNARQLVQAGAQAVKIEGADTSTCESIHYLVNSGIPVIGHIGLMPQFVHQFGGYKVQGKTYEDALSLKQQALDLEAAGCSAIVIECIPQHVATEITQNISIPTIGIGAGSGTDGQVLVWHDVLGLQTELKLKFLKQYMPGQELVLTAINAYTRDVKHGEFPTKEHAF